MPASSREPDPSRLHVPFWQFAVMLAVGAVFTVGAGGGVVVVPLLVPEPMMRSSRFGVSLVSPVTTPAVAPESSACETSAGEAAGFDARYSAAAPATKADACDVPLSRMYAESS